MNKPENKVSGGVCVLNESVFESFSSLIGCCCGQLLIPHLRTSLQINLQARASLLAAGGVFDQVKPVEEEAVSRCE